MYAFYLDGVQLPVAPPKLTLGITNKNKTITLINEGEVNILKMAGLTVVKFEMMIPQVKYPFAAYPDGFKEAAFYLDKLEKLKASKNPFQFIVSRVASSGKLLFDTNLTVAMEDYTIEEDARNGMDLLVSINLKQYREYNTKKIEISQSNQTGERKSATTINMRPSMKETPKTYTVKSGDTLWAICKKKLGDGSKYAEIAKLNGIKNPNTIYTGQEIRFG